MKSCSANKGRNFAQQPKATALLPLPLADARRRRTMHYHGMLLIHYLALLERYILISSLALPLPA